MPADVTAFDMRGVELGHHGGECAFETCLRHFELADPVLWDWPISCMKSTLATGAATRRKRRAGT